MAEETKTETPIVQNGVPPTAPDPKWAASQAYFASKAERAKPAAESEQKPEPAEAQPAAKDEKPDEAPEPKAAKSLASKLAGKGEASTSAWDENATRAFSRAGLKESEAAELAEKPWAKAWLDKLQKVQAKQDADYAALKAARQEGTREPTPGARSQSAQEQGDQPGSGQVADLFETLTKKLGEELGDDNATLLRQGFDLLRSQNDELRQELRGFTRSAQVARDEAEIEVMVQQSRTSLREEFPWIDDEARFEAVAAEMASMRPSEVSREGVADLMRKAARVVFFDDVRADAKAVASKLDTKRKTRLAETAPDGSNAADDGPVLDEFEISSRTMQMMAANEPKERISRWVQAQHERRRKSANQR
jgi:hypothetical protein